jgi:pyridoxine 5'-phosphate synthase PdxJ
MNESNAPAMDRFPSDSDLAAMANQVDEQLHALKTGRHATSPFRGSHSGPAELPKAPAQQAEIEQLTGESIETFWKKYKRSARRDLCMPGGLLHEQWRKWRELQSRDAVKVTLGVLAGMGISTVNITPLAVAATVFVINVVTTIGVEAVCEGVSGSDPSGHD